MRLSIDGRSIPVRTFLFPGGEVQVRIEDPEADTAPAELEKGEAGGEKA